MDIIMNVFGYPITYFEFFGVLVDFLSIYFAAKINVWTWSTGIVSSILFFILYFSTHTYANAILQIIFVVISINGWLNWGKENSKKVTNLKKRNILYLFGISIVSIIFFGHINSYSSNLYPYLDTSIFILSIIATILLANKKIESWFFWIAVNIISIILYSSFGYYLICIQCVIFIIIDIFALKEWNKNLIK